MGAAKVGKTAIINQFLYDTFTPKYTRTVEEMHHGEYEVGGEWQGREVCDKYEVGVEEWWMLKKDEYLLDRG